MASVSYFFTSKTNQDVFVVQEYAKVRFGHLQTILDNEDENGDGGGDNDHHQLGSNDVLLPLVLPHIPDLRRVIYTIYEYDPLLDSSNMTMDDWIQVTIDCLNEINGNNFAL